MTLLLTLPVARGALEAQRADAVLRALAENRPVSQQAIRDGMQALNRSVDADSSAARLFKRSELFAAAALSPMLKTAEPQRSEWLRQAQADVRQGLSRMLEYQWPPRTRLILSNWGYFTDEEKAKLTEYVLMTWRLEADRRWFGRMVYDVFDEVILRSLLRDEPMKSQEELSKYIRDARK